MMVSKDADGNCGDDECRGDCFDSANWQVENQDGDGDDDNEDYDNEENNDDADDDAEGCIDVDCDDDDGHVDDYYYYGQY